MEQISNSPAILKLMIFFLLYEYVTNRYTYCNINSSSFPDLLLSMDEIYVKDHLAFFREFFLETS